MSLAFFTSKPPWSYVIQKLQAKVKEEPSQHKSKQDCLVPLTDFWHLRETKLCAIWEMSGYISVRLCCQNLSRMVDFLWKLEPLVRKLFQLHVIFVYSYFYTVCLFNQSLILCRSQFVEEDSLLILSYPLSWSRPSGISLKYNLSTALCATSQTLFLFPCAVEVSLAQFL